MALADLRALARSYAATPAPGTPGTRNPQARGSGPYGAQAEETGHFPATGTRRTRGTRDFDNAGRNERSAPDAALAAACEARRDAIEHGERDDEGDATEPALPPPGTPERDRLDRQHARMVAGLLLGFQRHRTRHHDRS
jgi:hypothetical protein